HVVEAEQTVRRSRRQIGQRIAVDPRRRDVPADPVDREQAKGEQHPLAQLRNGEDVLQTIHTLTILGRTEVLKHRRVEVVESGAASSALRFLTYWSPTYFLTSPLAFFASMTCAAPPAAVIFCAADPLNL